jgi:hypothetical protein
MRLLLNLRVDFTIATTRNFFPDEEGYGEVAEELEDTFIGKEIVHCSQAKGKWYLLTLRGYWESRPEEMGYLYSSVDYINDQDDFYKFLANTIIEHHPELFYL